MFSISLLFIISYFFLFSLNFIYADMGYYQNTEAISFSHASINLLNPVDAYVTVILSSNQFAASDYPIYISFIGSFSTSGPHLFTEAFSSPGATYNSVIRLEREIGNLQKVYLENKYNDSVLIELISVRIKKTLYHFTIDENKWLQTFSREIALVNNGDGFSPDADIKLNSSPTLLFYVEKTSSYYSTISGQ